MASKTANGVTMSAALTALTDCIGPQMAAVDRLFTQELQSELPCVNVMPNGRT